MVKCSEGEENDLSRIVSLVGMDTKIHSYAEVRENEVMIDSSYLVTAKSLSASVMGSK